MPDAYSVYEARYVAEYTATSAANDLLISGPSTPRNKVRTIRFARVNCSVAETQNYWFGVVTAASVVYPVTAPASVSIAPAVSQYYPMLREGMELKLYPGEYLRAYRAAATAGSTISLNIVYIESDLPIYEQYEPQLRRAIIRRSSSPGQRSVSSVPAPPGLGPGSGGGEAPGGGGGAEPY